MAKDKYKATWVSHSSMADFLRCPRAYYLRNVYKDPKTSHKMTVMTPPLALGQVVHDIVESLSVLPVDRRLNESLSDKLEQSWFMLRVKRVVLRIRHRKKTTKQEEKKCLKR